MLRILLLIKILKPLWISCKCITTKMKTRIVKSWLLDNSNRLWHYRSLQIELPSTKVSSTTVKCNIHNNASLILIIKNSLHSSWKAFFQQRFRTWQQEFPVIHTPALSVVQHWCWVIKGLAHSQCSSSSRRYRPCFVHRRMNKLKQNGSFHKLSLRKDGKGRKEIHTLFNSTSQSEWISWMLCDFPIPTQ